MKNAAGGGNLSHYRRFVSIFVSIFATGNRSKVYTKVTFSTVFCLLFQMDFRTNLH